MLFCLWQLICYLPWLIFATPPFTAFVLIESLHWRKRPRRTIATRSSRCASVGAVLHGGNLAPLHVTPSVTRFEKTRPIERLESDDIGDDGDDGDDTDDDGVPDGLDATVNDIADLDEASGMAGMRAAIRQLKNTPFIGSKLMLKRQVPTP